MRFRTLSALVCFSLLVCACGQRGPLTMPKPAEQNTQQHNELNNSSEQTTKQ